MPRYYDLVDDRQSLTRWHLGAPRDEHGEEIDPWQFDDGKRLELGVVPRFPLEVEGDPLDFCWAAFSIIVVSDRFVKLFERLDVTGVQFLLAQIEGHPGPWYILNALQVIRCIDDTRSDHVLYWGPEDNRPDKLGEYRAVYGMRIDPSRVGEARIFRAWGWRGALIISEDLKQAMEAAGITGTRFIEV